MTAPAFFFGAMSPYSWFSAERIAAKLPQAEWRPVFAGGLFKAGGRTSWGLTDAREAGMADCEARARAHGLGEIRWPEPWPTNDLLVARAMVHVRQRGTLAPFALAAMRLSFTEGEDLGEREVVLRAARRAGLDVDEVAHALTDPDIKAVVRRATGEALELGVFGVPTVVVGGTLFWGDDRLDEAAGAA